MASKFFKGKQFFKGFSKVFKGPNNRGEKAFSGPTKYATIGGVKPKAKISDATKKFKAKVEATKKAIKKGTDDFKKQTPNRVISDKQIKKIQREQTEKSNKKSRREFLREKKAVGGIAGLGKKMGRDKQRGQEGQKRKPKFSVVVPDGKRRGMAGPQQPPKEQGQKRKPKFPDGIILMVPDGKGGNKTIKIPREKKFLGGRIKKKKPETKEQKSIKEKILPKKKKDRLEELRKELGMKKGGSALKPVDKQKNPGLAKLPTQVRNKMGYMKKGGSVRKFGGGKK